MVSFWANHGFLFGLVICLFCLFLPRLTLFCMSIFSAIGISFLGVVGWILLPRVTIAVITTMFYGHSNPFLCLMAWVCAFFGELGEKYFLYSR